jgi:hypothetical protein
MHVCVFACGGRKLHVKGLMLDVTVCIGALLSSAIVGDTPGSE